MLKFESIANVGDVIKAFDFEPMPGRPDRFISGVVIDKGPIKHPQHDVTMFDGYTIEILETDKGSQTRKGEIGYVPFEVSFMEYDERVTVIDYL
jgi:hypothetical protein